LSSREFSRHSDDLTLEEIRLRRIERFGWSDSLTHFIRHHLFVDSVAKFDVD
jgi:hypothetical protein